MGGRSLQLSFNVLNLFNQDTTVGRFSTYQQGQRLGQPDEAALLHRHADPGVADPTQAS